MIAIPTVSGLASTSADLGLLLLAAQWKKHAAWAVAPVAILLFLAVGTLKLPIDFQFPSESQTKNDAVLFYEEGGMATTKVWAEANQGNKLISVDGINIGGTGATDYKQQILAHLPKLLLKSYSSTSCASWDGPSVSVPAFSLARVADTNN